MPGCRNFTVSTFLENAHWDDVRKVTENIGKALQDAMRALEKANDRLYGIFGDAQWMNKERLPDRLLTALIEHFSRHHLGLKNVSQDDLGTAYEYLIKKFADDSGHTAAEFYTNRTVVHLMTKMLRPQSGENVYDPTCGTGGMLLNAVMELQNQGEEWRNVRLYGQEVNLLTSAIARMNLFLHDIEEFEIQRADTLGDPRFTEGDRLRQFDVIFANPPYSMKRWDRKKFTSDPFKRNKYGTPPQGNADYAFFQHIIASLAPETGRAAILYPHGILFRDVEAKMRKGVVESDIIEAVVGLGPNLFYNSPMESCVVVLRKQKPPERTGKILFINGVGRVTRERAQSFLSDADLQTLLSAYFRPDEHADIAHLVDLDEIRANGHNLSIPLYIRPQKDATEIDVNAAILAWQASRRQLRAQTENLFNTLAEVGFGD